VASSTGQFQEEKGKTAMKREEKEVGLGLK